METLCGGWSWMSNGRGRVDEHVPIVIADQLKDHPHQFLSRPISGMRRHLSGGSTMWAPERPSHPHRPPN
jgi:hypothetical protein